jgi:hypothetical protein
VVENGEWPQYFFHDKRRDLGRCSTINRLALAASPVGAELIAEWDESIGTGRSGTEGARVGGLVRSRDLVRLQNSLF